MYVLQIRTKIIRCVRAYVVCDYIERLFSLYFTAGMCTIIWQRQTVLFTENVRSVKIVKFPYSNTDRVVKYAPLSLPEVLKFRDPSL